MKEKCREIGEEREADSDVQLEQDCQCAKASFVTKLTEDVKSLNWSCGSYLFYLLLHGI